MLRRSPKTQWSWLRSLLHELTCHVLSSFMNNLHTDMSHTFQHLPILSYTPTFQKSLLLPSWESMPYSWRRSITAHMLIVSPVSRTWAFVGSLPMCGVLPPIHSSFCGHYGGSCFDISSLQPYSEHEVYNPMVESMFYSSFLCRLLVFLSIGWILNRMKDNRELYTHGRLIASFVSKGGHYHIM